MVNSEWKLSVSRLPLALHSSPAHASLRTLEGEAIQNTLIRVLWIASLALAMTQNNKVPAHHLLFTIYRSPFTLIVRRADFLNQKKPRFNNGAF